MQLLAHLIVIMNVAIHKYRQQNAQYGERSKQAVIHEMLGNKVHQPPYVEQKKEHNGIEQHENRRRSKFINTRGKWHWHFV